MNPEEQRIAIAEACGYRWMDYCHQGICKLYPPVPKLDECHGWYFTERREGTDLSSVPDYLNDLNAMNEAEKIFSAPSFRTTYASELYRVLGLNPFSMTWQPWFDVCHATAAQRAEAFLRTIGKWTD